MRRPRKHIPGYVKIKALLIMLGFDPERAIDWNHKPALGLREYDEDTGLYTPNELDPRYLEPQYAEAHDVITNGAKATSADGDIHKIAKAKRLAKEQEDFRRRTLGKIGKAIQEHARKAKRPWPPRPFRNRKQEVRT